MRNLDPNNRNPLVTAALLQTGAKRGDRKAFTPELLPNIGFTNSPKIRRANSFAPTYAQNKLDYNNRPIPGERAYRRRTERYDYFLDSGVRQKFVEVLIDGDVAKNEGVRPTGPAFGSFVWRVESATKQSWGYYAGTKWQSFGSIELNDEVFTGRRFQVAQQSLTDALVDAPGDDDPFEPLVVYRHDQDVTLGAVRDTVSLATIEGDPDYTGHVGGWKSRMRLVHRRLGPIFRHFPADGVGEGIQALGLGVFNDRTMTKTLDELITDQIWKDEFGLFDALDSALDDLDAVPIDIYQEEGQLRWMQFRDLGDGDVIRFTAISWHPLPLRLTIETRDDAGELLGTHVAEIPPTKAEETIEIPANDIGPGFWVSKVEQFRDDIWEEMTGATLGSPRDGSNVAQLYFRARFGLRWGHKAFGDAEETYPGGARKYASAKFYRVMRYVQTGKCYSDS